MMSSNKPKTTTTTTKVWSSSLNKSCQQNSAKLTKDSNSKSNSKSLSSSSPTKIRFDLNKAREKIRIVQEQYIRDEIEKDPWYHYSLRYRRRRQLEKLKNISIKQQQSDIDNVGDQQQQESVEQSSSTQLDDNLNAFEDLDDQYYLDTVNESIKNLLNNVDKVNDDDNDNLEQNVSGNNNKRSIFMLDEECPSSPSKRHRTISQVKSSSTTERKIFKHKRANNDNESNNDNDDCKKPPTIDPYSFFDHVKTLDFESTSTDSSLLSKQKPKRNDNDNDRPSNSGKEQSSSAKSINPDNVDDDDEPKKVKKKLTDVSNQLSINQDRIAKKKTTMTKKKQSINNNFRRLQMRKKRFYVNQKQSRFRNSKKNKFKQYKANRMISKLDNKCYKCGSNDHIEEECDNIPSLSVQFDEDQTGDGALDSSFDQSFDLGCNNGLYNDLDYHEVEYTLMSTYFSICNDYIRMEQRQIIKRIICGRSCLLVAPTGFGKSICYQTAALAYWNRLRSITLVISPLISLMQDQIRNLPSKLRGVCINSNQNERENATAISDIIEYRAQILFLSPECLVNGFQSIPFKSFPKIAFVCIDEAHCIASWSTNFRPSFLQLYESIRTKLNIRTVLALTATATKEMVENICKNLLIDQKNDVIGHTRIPDNLILTVSKSPTNKMKTLVNLLKQSPFMELTSIIIYCTRRDDCEHLASYIRTSLQFEKNYRQTESFAECYHAGLSSQQRRDIQRRFLQNKLRIVVATIAFGMGINKKDVMAVIHYDMPKSFENYVQEIGRAGRDGHPAICHLILDDNYSDLYRLQNFIYANGVDRENISKFIHLVYEQCHCRRLVEIFEDLNTDNNNDDNVKIDCPRHPVALPIFTTEIETDIKSEVLLTILMMLENKNNELNDINGELNGQQSFAIKVHSSFNSICHIVNFSDDEDFLKKLIEKDDILRHADVLMKRRRQQQQQQSSSSNGLWNSNTNFTFSIADVARLMTKDVWSIRKHLKSIQRKYRRQLGIRFSDYSFHFDSPGVLSNKQLENIIDSVYNRMIKFEQQEILKLRYTYQKLSEFRLNSLERKDDDKLLEKSDNLKEFLNQIYFGTESITSEIEKTFSTMDRKSINYSLPCLMDMRNDDYAAISYKITEFIQQFYDQGLDTARKIARILTGISSPQYSADIWARQRQFWRSLTDVDFEFLLYLTEQCLADHCNR
uniref:DNA 3'-5' helicase n=1 Tax=Dermatophagoides pteronyssinus TaxID=6956 RepID=A0A6P6XUM7_DERPT|nr:ATP-dependent DNA helicase Q4-like [Dermatophagoides pteronyssinus]